MKKIMLKTLAISMFGLIGTTHAMTALNDQELSHVDGQALLNLQNSYDSGQGINFSKLSVQALMELNANIKSLQLGCGGDKGAGCDIDISNIALSGLNPSLDSLGNPVFDANGRASTSAEITNPFVEFAIKGNSAATRQVVGFRVGAEQIVGLLTLGTENSQNPTDGIKSFSGYMKMAATQGEALTKAATFGNTLDESIQGRIKVDLLLAKPERVFTSRPGSEGHTGITVPSMRVNFTMPETIVSGQRINQAVVSNIRSSIKSIPLASGGDMTNVIGTPNWSGDQLYVDFDPLVLNAVGDHAFFKMLPGSSLDNLNMNITFEQALNMIHNIPLNGTGGYLSLQSEAVKWQGTDALDTAQPGWWMSFKDPIQLGYLKTQDEVDISYVLPQVATAITNFLLQPANIINVKTLEAIGSLLSEPVEKKLNIDVGTYTTNTPATLTLQNKILQNQNVTSNCFGGYKFC
ncbi:hypothetical protein ABEF90_11395 [Acinetobacter thermotolerans]|uniref:hypothetical protein n=1 Tax=Acinetobacter thermotolerans TaxID=3151487 RepID=UPI00325BA298